jgi:CRP-like cAMP-binding protein
MMPVTLRRAWSHVFALGAVLVTVTTVQRCTDTARARMTGSVRRHALPDAGNGDFVHSSTQGSQTINQLLTQLPDAERDALLSGAHPARLPVGHTILCAGDTMPAAYFPDSGVLAVVSEMATGHQVAVDIVGADGMIGVDALFHTSAPGYRVMVLAESAGYWIASDRLRRLCGDSEDFRGILLTHTSARLSEVMITAACNRVHSHRQRLARWLLIATDKAGRPSLDVTHETLAQLVGGPRHAVTVALNELRAKGAIAHLRGRLEIVEPSILADQACECYRQHGRRTQLQGERRQ